MSQDVGPDETWSALLAEGRFCAQRCTACDRAVFPPRVLCPNCGDRRLEFQLLSGLGSVYSTTVVRARSADGGPYNLALIDLDEGVRIMSRVEGLDPGDVEIGMRVRARIHRDSGNGDPLVVFDPSGHE
jgi:uncharacterized OB-fold protein